MNDEESQKGEESQGHTMRDAVLAFVLILCTGAGLLVATGKIPWISIPEEVTVPEYILLYSFLGGVAYLLSAVLGEYRLLDIEKKELETKEMDLEEKKDAMEKMKLAESDKETLSNLHRELKKVKNRLTILREDWLRLMDIWVKLARIPFGMLAAVAFYLLAQNLISEDVLDALGLKTLAGAAFVVAFFPKVIMEGLNGLAHRLIGKSGV